MSKGEYVLNEFSTGVSHVDAAHWMFSNVHPATGDLFLENYVQIIPAASAFSLNFLSILI